MRYLWGLAAFVILCGWWSPCWAQRGGPSPERFFNMLDRDGDGVIRGSEWDRVPPPMRDTLAEMEVDLERGVALEQFEELSNEMMQRMRERGGFGSRDRGRFGRGGPEEEEGPRRDFDRGDRPRFGRSSSEDEADSEDSGRRRFGRGRRDEGNSGDANSADSPRDFRRSERRSFADRNRSTRTKSGSENRRPRVTLDLPAEYASRDQDRDGQVGLYEWPQTDFDSFARLDQNGDGFLTPRELQRTDRPAAVPSVTVSAAPQTTPAPSTPRPAPRSTSTSSAGSSNKYDEAAAFAFRALDRDKDGVVGVDEWKRSRSSRPLFEKGGVDISQPMSREDFIAHYIRLRSQ